MSILTIGTNVKQEASTCKRPFFEPTNNTHSARSSISHPQLRDLLICPTQAHHVQTVSGHGIDAHVFGQYTMRLMDTPTSFLPNCLVSGCGYVAMGGGAADLLIRSTDIQSRWELKIITGQSIVNSVHFYQASARSNPHLLVCNNDQTITQYDLSTVSAIQDAASNSLSVDPAHRPHSQNLSLRSRETNYISGDGDNSSHRTISTVDEKPLLTHKSSIILPVPVNHCSVSPDCKSMVAVGDSNEVFIYDCRNTRQSNEPLITDWRLGPRKITLPGVYQNVGSFSTSWNQHGDKFAVASEGEVVVVYDMKMLGRPLLVKHTAQKGRPGGARVVKFSPAGPNELLAFTEHQSLVHVLDARTFDPDHEEILTVPTPLPGMTPFPPRFSPGSIRTQPTSNLDYDQDNNNLNSSSRSINELNVRLDRGSRSFRNSRRMGNEREDEPQQAEENEEEEEDDEGPREPIREMTYPIMEMTFTNDTFGEFTHRSSPEPSLVDRMWRGIQDRNDDHLHQTSSSLNHRGNQILGGGGVGPRGSRVQRGYSWAARSRLPNVGDDEACLDVEGETIGQPTRLINTSSSNLTSTSIGRPRIEWDTNTSNSTTAPSASTSRQAQLHGSSIRVLSLENERRTPTNQTTSTHHYSNLIPTTGSSSRVGLIHHRAANSNSISNIHSQLINNRLGMGRSPTRLSQTEAWFDLELSGASNNSNASGTTGNTNSISNGNSNQHNRNSNNPLYSGLISSSSVITTSTYSGVRSGMWDDLIGLTWSPDGDYLISGTEVGLVEWKVKTSTRNGFGDSRLC